MTCPLNVYLWRARDIVGTLTFQSPWAIKRYFSTMLNTAHDWPLDEIKAVIDTRNDLIHRNGITPLLEPVRIGTKDVSEAIPLISRFIEMAAETLLQEDAPYRSDDNSF